MILGDNLQKYTYAYLMRQALGYVPDTIDKREGSIIYDALAPACYVLADYYMQLYQMVQETYVLTASSSYLDAKVREYGVDRLPATAAVKRADFTNLQGVETTVPIGSRFSTISGSIPLIYRVIGQYEDTSGVMVPGAYRLECETEGTVGHGYTGNILPLDYLPTLGTAIMSSTVIPGRDVETDDALRQRYLAKVNTRAFGGNIAQYRQMIMEDLGAGGVQVYPVWNGGGTVMVSVVTSELLPAPEDFIAQLQNEIDPTNGNGQGMGLGMAPIDHWVTVVTPTAKELTVGGHLTLVTGVTYPQVQDAIEAAIEVYIAKLRTTWDQGNELNQYSLTVYVAQIAAAILSVPGVANLQNTTVNGSSEDLVLVESAALQELPILKEVAFDVS